MSRRKIQLKNDQQIRKLRAAGKLVADTFEMLEPHIQPGVTTGELDQIVEAFIRAHGAEPSFKGYNGFTGSICVAVNDVVVHGIPGRQALREGDIIAVDIGARLDGWHGDATITFPVGKIDSESQRLMDVCKASLDAGIEVSRAGNRLSDVSSAVQKVVEQAGFNVVRDLFAHGVGRNLHEAPSFPHYGDPGRGPRLKEGMVYTIEPMIVAGSKEVNLLSDGWTIITVDGSRSAQYEHTIAITSNGPLILTAP
ncbi:MAG: type I methionyl aminopeptidase [Thermomicrobiales bacterium]